MRPRAKSRKSVYFFSLEERGQSSIKKPKKPGQIYFPGAINRICERGRHPLVSEKDTNPFGVICATMKIAHLLLGAAVVCLLAAGLSAHAGDAPLAQRALVGEPQPTKFATLYNVRPVRMVAPVVPQEAVQRRLKSGEITLSFDVTPDGYVREVRVVRASPEGVFDDAFVEAGKKWVFKESKGKWDEPVYFEIINSYRFKLAERRIFIR